MVDIVPLPLLFKCVFSAYRSLNDPKIINFILANDSMVMLTTAKFIDLINLWVPPYTVFKITSNEEVFKALYRMGYQSKLKGIVDLQKEKLPTVWQFVCH